MKESEKKDSDKKGELSSPDTPSADSTENKDQPKVKIPSAPASQPVKKQALNIRPSDKSSEKKVDNTSLEMSPLSNSDSSEEAGNSAIVTDNQISKNEINLEATDSFDTEELENEDFADKTKNMDDTDNFDAEDLESLMKEDELVATASLDKKDPDLPHIPEDEVKAFEYSYHEDESEDYGKKTSIMDLLDKKEVSEIDMADTDPNLSETLSGKSLDDILKTSQKSEDDWHESKNESITEKKKVQKKHKNLKIILGIAIGIIVTAAIVMHIVKSKLHTPEQDPTILPLKAIDIKIPKNLKDENKLSRYFSLAENLYKGEKYKQAESIFKKLLKTGWKTGMLNGYLGNCRLKQNDEKSAAEYFKKSFEAGYNENIEFALNFAKILNKEKKFSELISILEPFKKGGSANQEMLSLLSVAYQEEGMPDKTLECYKMMNPSMLKKKQLKEYASILEKNGEKNQAFKIYLTLGKLYGETQAYLKAEELAPDKTTRLSILAQIVGKTANTPQGIYHKMRLGLLMFQSGNKKEGLQILKGVDAEKLNKRDATKYLLMLPDFEGERFLIQEALSVLVKYFANDVKMHEIMKEKLLEEGKIQLCYDFFKNEYILYPKNHVSCYMYAGLHPLPQNKIKYYKKAISLKPDFFEANLALCKLYIDEQKLKEALKLIKKCLELRPYSNDANYCSAILQIKTTGQVNALRDYEKFLKLKNTPKEELLKQMITLSQYMKNERFGLYYLKQAEKISSLEDFCKRESVKMKLIYGSIKRSDFKDIRDPVIKKYYVIYLLGKGQFSDVMSIPTRKEDFPDFWKVFICWKKDIPSWEKNANLLIGKHKNDLLITTAAKMWLRKIKLAEAALLLDRLDHIDKPLLCILIAEQYKKDMNPLKSRIFFRNALKYPNPNIYVQVAEYLRRNK